MVPDHTPGGGAIRSPGGVPRRFRGRTRTVCAPSGRPRGDVVRPPLRLGADALRLCPGPSLWGERAQCRGAAAHCARPHRADDYGDTARAASLSAGAGTRHCPASAGTAAASGSDATASDGGPGAYGTGDTDHSDATLAAAAQAAAAAIIGNRARAPIFPGRIPGPVRPAEPLPRSRRGRGNGPASSGSAARRPRTRAGPRRRSPTRS